MASLTESSIISQQINNNKNKSPDDKWYDRVYLCEQETGYSQLIVYNCTRHTSFKSAYYSWEQDRENDNKFKLEIRHTMIPMCKFIPEIFDNSILNWKLRNIYWLDNNSFGKDSNKYP